MTTLSGAPKTTAKKATDLGWIVQHSTSTVHVPDVLLENDGKTGQKGDVRTPAHDELIVAVAATHPQGQVGFAATWTDSPSAATIKVRAARPFMSRRWLSASDARALAPSLTFTDARIADPLGIPVENWCDYSMSKVYAKSLGLGPLETAEIERRRDYEYNDGSTRQEHRYYTKKATELSDWLNGWLEIIAPDKAPKKKAVKPTVDPQERALEPLTLGEWNG